MAGLTSVVMVGIVLWGQLFGKEKGGTVSPSYATRERDGMTNHDYDYGKTTFYYSTSQFTVAFYTSSSGLFSRD